MQDQPVDGITPYDPAKDPLVGTVNTIPNTAPVVDAMHPQVTIDSVTVPGTRALVALPAAEAGRAFEKDILAVLVKHSAKGKTLDLELMLALGGHVVGRVAALQDPRVMTPSRIVDVVNANMVEGNVQARASLNQISNLKRPPPPSPAAIRATKGVGPAAPAAK